MTEFETGEDATPSPSHLIPARPLVPLSHAAEPIKYLSVDPGKTVGYALFSANGETIARGQLDWEMFNHVLMIYMSFKGTEAMAEGFTVIYESYTIRSQDDIRANSYIGNKFETSQVIGMIKLFALYMEAECIEQSPNILGTAQLWTGVSLKKLAHSNSHWASAYNHGEYYLISTGVNKNPAIERLRGQKAETLARWAKEGKIP